MAELFKNIYNEKFFNHFCKATKEHLPNFNETLFLKQIYDSEWEQRELKQRMRHITTVLHHHLSINFDTASKVIIDLIPVYIKNGFTPDNLEFIFLADYVEVYGINHFKTATQALERITQFVSCEFAVRPFIIKYEEKMIPVILQWSNHKNFAVRRLSTEGSRPRLPWGMAIPSFKKDPTPIIPLLENLKNDTSETVRRSVANNLNDISKDNPDIVIAIAYKWQNISKETDWLIKHACRTLLKQGNTKVMQLFGFGAVDQIKVSEFKINTPKVSVGGYLEFSFKLANTSTSTSKIRLEYGLYYQKANGTLSRKVFKISEKEYQENSETHINRKQSFKIITTRKFHLGKHQVSIIINGTEFSKKDFTLTN